MSQISNQILTYLVEHPEARDTVDGIVEWWLLERAINFQTARVKEALSELVAKGMLLERRGPDSQIHYQINPARYKEIRALFGQKNR